MRGLLGSAAWLGAGLVIAQGLLSATPTHTASVCEDINTELNRAVIRQELSQDEAKAIYNRCINSIGGY